MSANGWLQFVLFSAILLASVRPVGLYLARVLEGERTWLTPVLRPIERLIYRLSGINSTQEMSWREYACSVLGFSAVSLLVTYGIERLQSLLPWNPQGLASVGPDLAWNTAASFTTNTNWQSYAPETTMSYLTQMAGLAYHNFLSAAVGIAVAVALIRGIKRTSAGTIGNFWVDATRTLLYVLLPASLIYALLLIGQGVPQNLNAYTTAHPQGPVASQEAIKMLGTNGGGFFNANSAHPFENPTPFSNLLEMLSIFIIPAGLTYTLGRMTGSPGHGWAVFAAMFVLFTVGFTTVYWAESQSHPLLHGVAQSGSATAPAGNMEGKEVRFGITGPPCSPPPPPAPPAARSTPCTTPSRRWAAWCRSPTLSSAKWSSAASGCGSRCCSRPSCARATWCWWRPASSSPATATSSRASPRWTKRHHRRSAPVIRESGGDRSAVTGGTKVLSDWIKVRSPPTPARPSSTA
jgi:K+-transporting ATPase ATPase A chain